MMTKKRSRFTTSVRCALMIAVGFVLLAGTQTAMAEDTVRDHRGANGAAQGGVTVNGKPVKPVKVTPPSLGGPKDKNKDKDKNKGSPTGATVRDHRDDPKRAENGGVF